MSIIFIKIVLFVYASTLAFRLGYCKPCMTTHIKLSILIQNNESCIAIVIRLSILIQDSERSKIYNFQNMLKNHYENMYRKSLKIKMNYFLVHLHRFLNKE